MTMTTNTSSNHALSLFRLLYQEGLLESFPDWIYSSPLVGLYIHIYIPYVYIIDDIPQTNIVC
jgi:hypothetical protein